MLDGFKRCIIYLAQASLSFTGSPLSRRSPKLALKANQLIKDGGLLLLLGKYHEAEEIYTETKEIRQRVSGVDHELTRHAMQGLAMIYKSQQRYHEAEELYRTIMDRAISDMPYLDSKFLAINTIDMADAVAAQGRSPRREAAMLRRLQRPSNCIGTVSPLSNHGRSTWKQNQRNAPRWMSFTATQSLVGYRDSSMGCSRPIPILFGQEIPIACAGLN
jgi:tetratricopeptide (TPR) repeat protein